ASSGASSASRTMPSLALSARISNCMRRLPAGDVGRLARATRLAVLAEREEIVFAVFAGCLVDVRTPPRIGWHRLLQVWTAPLRLVLRLDVECREALLARRIVADVDPVRVEGFLQRRKLGLCGFHFGLAQLCEVLRPDVCGKQPDDHHDNEQFEQGETG